MKMQKHTIDEQTLTPTPLSATSGYVAVYKRYLHHKINLSAAAWHDLELISKLKHVPKREVLVAEGFSFNQEVFIVEGVLRAYTLTEQGHEQTTAFYQSCDFMSVSSLRSQGGHSISTYQAITETTVITLEAARFRRLIGQYPALMALAKFVKSQEIDRLKNRDDCLMQVAGVEKYLKYRYFLNL